MQSLPEIKGKKVSIKLFREVRMKGRVVCGFGRREELTFSSEFEQKPQMATEQKTWGPIVEKQQVTGRNNTNYLIFRKVGIRN